MHFLKIDGFCEEEDDDDDDAGWRFLFLIEDAGCTALKYFFNILY